MGDEVNVNMFPVVSSNMKAIGYDATSKVLYVEFLTGAKYVYRNVPVETFGGLMAAESHGKYLNSEVKNKYDYEKISA